jgi:hypothetical protein
LYNLRLGAAGRSSVIIENNDGKNNDYNVLQYISDCHNGKIMKKITVSCIMMCHNGKDNENLKIMKKKIAYNSVRVISDIILLYYLKPTVTLITHYDTVTIMVLFKL